MGVLRYIARAMSAVYLRVVYASYLRWAYLLRGIEGINRVMLRTRHPRFVLTRFGATVGEGTVVYPHIHMHAAMRDYRNLVIGEKCRIMRDCLLDLTDRIEVEDGAIVGLRTCILTHQNFGDSPLMAQAYPPVAGPVRLATGAVTCANSTILRGVTIGACAVVGAGAVVLRDVPAHAVAVGNPARVVRRRIPQ